MMWPLQRRSFHAPGVLRQAPLAATVERGDGKAQAAYITKSAHQSPELPE